MEFITAHTEELGFLCFCLVSAIGLRYINRSIRQIRSKSPKVKSYNLRERCSTCKRVNTKQRISDCGCDTECDSECDGGEYDTRDTYHNTKIEFDNVYEYFKHDEIEDQTCYQYNYSSETDESSESSETGEQNETNDTDVQNEQNDSTEQNEQNDLFIRFGSS